MHKHCDTAVTKPTAKATPLALAMAAALGLSGLTYSPQSAADIIIGSSWQGVFTLLNVSGSALNNADYGFETNYYGFRTPISGTYEINLTTGAGSLTVTPFSFASGGLLTFTNASLQAIGNGMGGPGTLMLGNMGFNWSGTNGIPVSIVWDASGFMNCLLDGFTFSETCAGVGALAETEETNFSPSSRHPYGLPLGPVPIATTDWNTSTLGGTSCGLGCNPSGTLPLLVDTTVDTRSFDVGEVGIGGSPMVAGPFPGWNLNLDFLSIHIGIPPQCTSCPDPVPLPAAAWLFGSGLLGLLGVARRQLQQRRR